MLRVFLFVVGAFMITACEPEEGIEQASNAEKVFYSLEITESNGEKNLFKVELAVTPEQKRTGLMYRTEMAEDAGMIFDFGMTRPITMWMKNTYIPLDMVFIDESGEITGIAENTTPLSEDMIHSPVPARAVLEINGGIARKLGIKKGDIVSHSMFDSKKTP